MLMIKSQHVAFSKGTVGAAGLLAERPAGGETKPLTRWIKNNVPEVIVDDRQGIRIL